MCIICDLQRDGDEIPDDVISDVHLYLGTLAMSGYAGGLSHDALVLEVLGLVRRSRQLYSGAPIAVNSIPGIMQYYQ